LLWELPNFSDAHTIFLDASKNSIEAVDMSKVIGRIKENLRLSLNIPPQVFSIPAAGFHVDDASDDATTFTAL
jgi:hypothetical protein